MVIGGANEKVLVWVRTEFLNRTRRNSGTEWVQTQNCHLDSRDTITLLTMHCYSIGSTVILGLATARNLGK